MDTQNCPCSVKYPTIVKSFNDILNKKRDVYLYNEDGKVSAFYKCTRKTYDSEKYCWKHWDTHKKDPTKIKFYTDIINSKNARIATVNDDYYSKKKKIIVKNKLIILY